LNVAIATRLPPGDVFPFQSVNVWSYGTPVIGQWVRFKIPLSDLHIGNGTFVGSISGTTLTVASISSGVALDAGGFITGTGIPAGTYIVGYNQQSSVGTFTIAGPGISGSTSVSSETMNYRRTGFYKSYFQWGTDNSTSFYVNNLGFSVN